MGHLEGLTSQLTSSSYRRDVKLGVPCLDAACTMSLNLLSVARNPDKCTQNKLKSKANARQNGMSLLRFCMLGFAPLCEQFLEANFIILSFADEEVGGKLGMAKFIKTDIFKKMNIGFGLDEGRRLFYIPLTFYDTFYYKPALRKESFFHRLRCLILRS